MGCADDSRWPAACGSHGRHRAFFYACGSYHQRGKNVCTNRLELPIAVVDGEVLARLDALITPDVLADAVNAAIALASAPPTDTAKGAREELATIEQELGRLAPAIAAGGQMDTLLTALKARQQRADVLRGQVRRAEAPAVAPPSPQALRTALEARAKQWRDVLAGQVTQARQLLRKVLAGPIVCTPARRDVEGWAIEGAAALDKVISGGKDLPRYLASQIFAGWNQVAGWLRALETLRRAA